ncbi:MAG: hypothetical protein ACOYT8_00485 [Candidatus Dependentiae bacterium]
MSVLRAWKDSWREVVALTSKNGRVLGSAIYKKIKNSYATLFSQWWFLLGIVGALIVLMGNNSIESFAFEIYKVTALLGSFLYIFILFLLIRPSVLRKTYSYYGRYILYAIGFLCATIIIAMGINFLYAHVFKTNNWFLTKTVLVLFPFNFHVLSITKIPSLVWFVGFSYAAFISFFTLFWLDASITITSFLTAFKNAFLMIFYNLPFVFLLSLFAAVGAQILLFLCYIIPCKLVSIFIIIGFAPIVLSVFSIFYSKKVHEQFDLYFPIKLIE